MFKATIKIYSKKLIIIRNDEETNSLPLILVRVIPHNCRKQVLGDHMSLTYKLNRPYSFRNVSDVLSRLIFLISIVFADFT